MNQFPIMWQGDNILMVIDGKPHTINKNTSKNYGEVVDAIKIKDWERVADLVIIKEKPPISFDSGYISVRGTTVTYSGRPLPSGIGKMLIRLIDEELPLDYFINFINNLMNNTSNRSIEQLYDFLDKNSMPITEDGCFMAYKSVENDYLSRNKDEVTGEHVRYMVGDEPSMPRSLISDDPSLTCHRGLHACAMEYLAGWGGKHLMLVKINPADVVCVPFDSNRSKMRVCKMQVISEVLRDDGSPWYSDSINKYDVLSQKSDDDYGCDYNEDYVSSVRESAFDEGEAYDEGYDNGYDEGYDVGVRETTERFEQMMNSVKTTYGPDHDFGGD